MTEKIIHGIVRRSLKHVTLIRVRAVGDILQLISIHPDKGPVPNISHLLQYDYDTMKEIREDILDLMKDINEEIKKKEENILDMVLVDNYVLRLHSKKVEGDVIPYKAKQSKGGRLLMECENNENVMEIEFGQNEWNWKPSITVTQCL